MADIGGALVMSVLPFIQFSDNVPIVQIKVSYHVCAIHSNDRIRCWGNGVYQQLGNSNQNFIGTGNSPNSITDSVYVSFGYNINTIRIVSVSVGG